MLIYVVLAEIFGEYQCSVLIAHIFLSIERAFFNQLIRHYNNATSIHAVELICSASDRMDSVFQQRKEGGDRFDKMKRRVYCMEPYGHNEQHDTYTRIDTAELPKGNIPEKIIRIIGLS